MLGPFLLKYAHLFVNTTSAGVFILSRNGRTADYVGATGEDLVGTLGRFARQSDYRYFWCVEARSEKEAAEIEQAWRHRYRPTDNVTRAASLHGDGWRCLVEGCPTCALAASAR
jgi:hypothetical protein